MRSMLPKLPGWVVNNATSVREECADYRDMTLEQRGQVLSSVCRTVVSLALGRADRDVVFGWRDKLPASTVAALERPRGRR